MIYSWIKRAWVWLLLTGLCLVFTPYMFAYADKERGYDAIGGEIFFPLLPLVAWLLYTTIKDIFKELKYRNESEESENDSQM